MTGTPAQTSQQTSRIGATDLGAARGFADQGGLPGRKASGTGRSAPRTGVTFRHLGAGLAVGALAFTVAACGGHKAKPTGPVGLSVTRGQQATVPFSSAGGDVILTMKTASPEASWGTMGSESAVLSLSVDGKYASDVVIATKFTASRSIDLGDLTAGSHTLNVKFDDDRSPSGTKTANVTDLKFSTLGATDAGYTASQFAPIVYGRSGQGATADLNGPFQTAVTDTPMVAFHTETQSTTPGNTIYRYSVVYSDEDGAPSVPEMLAQWGRSAEINWVYQVEVDATGKAVPGSAMVRGQDGSTVPYTGGFEGTRPVIQTCGLTNDVCGKTDGQMRYTLSVLDNIDPENEAPESIMDDNPWTYWMMSQELIREGKTAEDPLDDPSANPTKSAGDPRSYLYLVLRKSTQGTTPNTDNAWVGVTIGIKLAGNPTIYRSDLGVAKWSLRRDEPAATAIALPPGSVADDIEQIRAVRVVGAGRDTKAKVQIESIERAFFLDADYLPQSSFLFAPVQATLTAANPAVTLLDRANGPIIRPSGSATPTDGTGATPSPTSTSLLPGITIGPSLHNPFGGATTPPDATLAATAKASTTPKPESTPTS
ncbi:hypothetical protein I6A60_17405 [Frankia sp. AgB1.9]|uniref:hypothetical protein n=1 Tax=unclassified Frankia TaxID=2632575 RepID=UPI001931DD66|nr:MULTISPECIES: hypothetical protein [unclassified Frankia]MBL7494630.1 hypothetical protein [Frankia sp. AgW1.1]MBL7549637.1 hypothetical protein [Frankia sp. AgB1.9]MBL7623311.1 hypothetical protein [Frankia sp. AgB1.8]